MANRLQFIQRCATEAFSRTRAKIELLLFVAALAGSFYVPSWWNTLRWPLVVSLVFGIGFVWEIFVVAPHRMVMAAENRLRDMESLGLRGSVKMLALCETDRKEAGICVLLQLTNTGPPTIADNWGIKFNFRQCEVGFAATHSPTGEIKIPATNGTTVSLKSEDMLYEKLAAPIPQGCRASGFLFFKTKGISYDELVSAQPAVTVVFRDAAGREYETQQLKEGGTTTPLHEPGVNDPFAQIYHRQRRDSEAGQRLYYKVVEKIGQGVRPITALIQLGVADELDTNADVVRFCDQLVRDNHGNPFEHLSVMYPRAVWQAFLQEARRKNLKFENELSDLEYMNERIKQHEVSLKEPNPKDR